MTFRFFLSGRDYFIRYLRRFFSQKNNRIYILPNQEGLIYLVVLAFVFLVAILDHVNLTYFVLALSSGIFFAGLVFTNYNLAGVHLRPARVHSAHVGGHARIELRVENRSRRTRHNLKVELPVNSNAEDFAMGTILQLKPGRAVLVEMVVPLSKRGRYEVLRVRLSTTFPFGLFRSWSWLKTAIVYFAYPRLQGDLPLPITGELHQEFSGRNHSRLESNEADFSDHKAYEFGDSIRHINWRMVARGLPPHVKQFKGGCFKSVKIDLEQLERIPDLEQRLCQVANWIRLCRRNEIPFQVRFAADEVYTFLPPDKDPRICLERLAVWQPGAPNEHNAPFR